VKPTRARLVVLSSFVLLGCGGDHAVEPGAGGTTSRSGGSGGTAATRATGTGGATSAGGSTAAGGGQTGGASANGGAASGGRVGTGGGPATGGNTTGSGGRASGGAGTGGTGGSGGARPDAGPVEAADAQSPPDAPSADAARDDLDARDTQAAPEVPADRPTEDTPPSGVYKPAFILGADVTISLEDEYWGATYTDEGQQKSIEQILKDHGFNFVRLDTFVNPGAPGGYADGKPEAFRDLAHTITFGKRIKKLGMGLMVDFHYSDTWTNPSQHATPAAWAGLSLAALETKVYDYTKDALAQLTREGAQPDMVSVGNEITNGMLWETGRISGSAFANFATLLKAGVRAVREANPDIVIVMHLEKCNNLSTSKWWLDGVLGQGVSFDVLGQSCYATAPNGVTGYQGTPAEWKSTFTQLASAYPNLKFLIAEYSAEQRAAGDVMFGLPDQRGLGTFNWDPTRAYETHPNDPLFSTNGAWNRYVTIPAKMALYEKMATDYGLRAP
jgi:arabinogalactan endo-1,4-beta-galactosidase